MRKGLSVALTVAVFMVTPGCLAKGYEAHPLTLALVERLVEEHDFDRQHLLALFGEVEKKQSIIDAMNRPAEKVKPWYEYRQIFLQEKRIDAGVEFWRQNADTLEKAQQRYGVDPAIIVAIIGVETYYGRIRGSYRVMDALSTLAFDYPKRSPFFTRELENFLILTREQEKDPLSLKGSYAGAMGYGQFMPSSYRNYAIDFDGDGVTDIWDNTEDAIGSVANYFVAHGWRPGEPVVTPAIVQGHYGGDDANALKGPEKTVAELAALGLRAREGADADAGARAMPLRYEGEDGDEYWLGFENFYVITRYNHSHRYAMAVYQLSEMIRQRMGRENS
ncbi:MAG: lytic murein transglycosylase B [Porticoccaceae bacterium]|nr:lytic murein transglycosylase B [Porticoccaceae bacterium]